MDCTYCYSKLLPTLVVRIDSDGRAWGETLTPYAGATHGPGCPSECRLPAYDRADGAPLHPALTEVPAYIRRFYAPR